jgi:hypothetical protein
LIVFLSRYIMGGSEIHFHVGIFGLGPLLRGWVARERKRVEGVMVGPFKEPHRSPRIDELW